ncbi:MAG: isopropylmalate synthase, partial [Acetanaerobacterium sp.]
MIQITDMTLSCLDDYDPSAAQLHRLLELLMQVGTDCIELSVKAYQTMGALPCEGRFMLRCEDLSDVQDYPHFFRYVCRKTGRAAAANVVSEVQANDICEINFLNQFFCLENIRIRGLDDILLHDYPVAFGSIRKTVKGKVQLCPEDKYGCATAIAVEWILQGGRDVVASFAGIGGFAPLEEVIMALHIAIRYRPNMDASVFPAIRRMIEEITGERIHANKPIIGEKIFDMEAGIHADAIAKNPLTYEPFRPELVGNSRTLVIGKHSGRNALLIKMKELGLPAEGVDTNALL